MPLPSFLKRARSERAPLASAAEPASLDPGVIEQARARARRRLIGAAILVAAAVIGLPLLFDSAPRSLPHDVGVEVLHGDGRVTAALPQPSPAAPAGPADSADSTEDRVADVRPPRAAVSRQEEAPAPASKASEPKAPAPKASTPKATAPKGAANDAAKKAEDKAEDKPDAPRATEPKAAVPKAAADGARALALLEGKDGRVLPAAGGASGASGGAARPAAAGSVSPAAAQRFVVQIGAFADVGAAREARQKVEKLGLKTYTQVINNEGGRRIRVRVGPFDDRRSADQAAAKIRQAGLGAAVLTL